MSNKNYLTKSELSHEQWLAGRKNYLGASETAAVLGLDKYVTPFMVWAMKTGKMEKIENPELAERAEAGTRAEDFIAAWLADLYDLKIRKDNKIRLHPEMPFWGANLDRLIVGKEIGPIPLELKTGTHESIRTWSITADEVNPVFMHHWVQVQAQLAVTGYNTAYIGAMPADSFRGFGRPRLIEIEPDLDFIEGIENKIRDFWEKNVMADVPPEIKSLGDLTVMFPRSKAGKVIVVTNEIHSRLSAMKMAQESITLNDKVKEEVKEEVALWMGDAEEAIWNDDTILTFKSGKDVEQFNEEEFKNNFPDEAKECAVIMIDEELASSKFPEQYKKCVNKFPGKRTFLPKYKKI